MTQSHTNSIKVQTDTQFVTHFIDQFIAIIYAPFLDRPANIFTLRLGYVGK